MKPRDDDLLAKRFFLSATVTSAVGVIAGWLWYDVSGAVIGGILGAMLGLLGGAVTSLRRREK